MIRFVKNALVPSGAAPRRVLAGPFKDLHLNLDLTSQSQLYVGLFEKEIAAWLVRFSNGIRSAVDIGVAHGEYTLFALGKTTAESVFAFEPNQMMAQVFRSNLRLNRLEHDCRLHFFQKFLGSSAGADTIAVDWLADQIKCPCLLKMDIDGGEKDVLSAASLRLLRMPGLRWIVETHSKALEAECLSILSTAGFATRIIPNAWWRLIVPEQRDAEQNRWLVATDDPSLMSLR